MATTDLLNCRRVNQQWNEISSRIIRNRDDITIHFKFVNGEFVKKIYRHDRLKVVTRGTLGVKKLSELVACVQDSQDFLCRSYRFDGIEHLESVDIRSFLNVFGEKIHSLEILLCIEEKFSEVLRTILFETPNLKKFKIGDSWSSSATISCSDTGLWSDPHQSQLPKLEAFFVDWILQLFRPKVIEDILAAASNLKVISYDGHLTSADLQMLHSTQKFHCLKDVRIGVTRDTIDYWKKSPKCLELQSVSLRLTICNSIYDSQQLKGDAVEMLNELFRWYKDIIHSLHLVSLEALEGLVFPKFEKLKKLSLCKSTFPGSFDWIHSFPNVRELCKTNRSIIPMQRLKKYYLSSH